MGADHDVHAVIWLLQSHSVSDFEGQIRLLEVVVGKRHRGFVDIDACHVLKVIRQIIIDDAAGATDIQQTQIIEAFALQKILTDSHEGQSFFLASLTVEYGWFY
tara:strand:- start:30484 stop:30795 length:312 start_codon:yes stop_codon:yes gene_type:complete